jgi:hypothetical protein
VERASPATALLPIKRSATAIDKKFVEYLLELSEGVTGRIIEVPRRAALQGIADKTQKVGLVQLQAVGAKMPSVQSRVDQGGQCGHFYLGITRRETKVPSTRISSI